MGQYYNTLIERDKNIKVYDRKLDGEYMWAKLMEHSWWENDWLK